MTYKAKYQYFMIAARSLFCKENTILKFVMHNSHFIAHYNYHDCKQLMTLLHIIVMIVMCNNVKSCLKWPLGALSIELSKNRYSNIQCQ